MEKKMENDMTTGIYEVLYRDLGFPELGVPFWRSL